MSIMKSKIVTIIVGGIVTVTSLTFCFLAKDKCDHAIQSAQFMSVCGTEEDVIHDWECKFCIEDGYNGDGKVMFHYIDEYTRNVDHSITFVGHDGLLWTIPYPYFYIHVNEHYRGSEHNVNPNHKK